MNKELQTIYVPISVGDRLPEHCFNTVKRGDGWGIAYFHKDEKLSEQWSEDIYGSNLVFPAYWLEKQSKIILSQEEWGKLTKQELLSDDVIIMQEGQITGLNKEIDNRDKEIERLKGLIEQQFYLRRYNEDITETDARWQQFREENNIKD